MKKMLPILTLAFLLVATPVTATSEKGSKEIKDRKIKIAKVCNPEGDWKNHGEYVSCMAKLKQGGQTTSLAAKSDIGKKNGDEVTNEGEVGGNPAQSASPSASPFVNPSATPVGSPAASPSASPSASITDGVMIELRALTEVFKNILDTLQKLYVN